jgi:hypothetical protein
LFYYLNPQVAEPSGFIPLDNYLVERDQGENHKSDGGESVDLRSFTGQISYNIQLTLIESILSNIQEGKKYCFRLIPDNPSSRTYYIFSDDEQDLNEWVSTLSKRVNDLA